MMNVTVVSVSVTKLFSKHIPDIGVDKDSIDYFIRPSDGEKETCFAIKRVSNESG